MDDTQPALKRVQQLGWAALEHYYQTQYCDRVWHLVEELIRMGQHAAAVSLDRQQKRVARAVVVGWVIEFTGLPVDLSLTQSLVSIDPDQLPLTHREIDDCRQQLYQQFPDAMLRLRERDF